MPDTKFMTAHLGGALIHDSLDFGKDGCATRDDFMETWGRIAHINIDLPSGETLHLFYNDETRLFVADIINEDGTGGNEFVRCTVPKPPTSDELA